MSHERAEAGFESEIRLPPQDMDYQPFTCFFASKRGGIFHLFGVLRNLRLLRYLQDHDYLLVSPTWAWDAREFREVRRALQLFGVSPANVFIMCADENERDVAASVGLGTVRCNQNVLVDPACYPYRPCEKRYDAVMNASLVYFKRCHLAAKVGSLALIAGRNFERADYRLQDIPHELAVCEVLDAQGVSEILLQSRVGLCLSAVEGPCFASSEYLLSGLPVVSTASRGGRDFWYDAYNSLICEDSPEAVAEAVRELAARVERGEVDPQRVRGRHIERAEEQKQNLFALMADLFDRIGVEEQPGRVFARVFKDKLAWMCFTPFADARRVLTERW